MKLKVKIKLKREELQTTVHNSYLISGSSKKGDWCDLEVFETKEYNGPTVGKDNSIEFESYLLDLGIAMKLPKGFEAIVVPRSSLWKYKGIMQTNSIGVIDNSYCGPDDFWKFSFVAFRKGTIYAGDRVCQFRIQLSQHANLLAKLKWLFTSGIVFEVVDSLDGANRGGFGSTKGYSGI